MKEGWLCPRCKKVNAPFIPVCSCQENYYTNNATNCINGNHQWECCGVSTAGSTYRCKVCGETKTENYNVDKSDYMLLGEKE